MTLWLIIWIDSYTHDSGWQDNDEFNDSDVSVPLACTVGFKITENQLTETYSQSTDFGSHSNQAISIPKSAILKRVKSRVNVKKHLKEVTNQLEKEEIANEDVTPHAKID